jgi:hypothetical protein
MTLCHGSHPVVGGIVRASYRSVLGRWVSYLLPPLCGVVLLARCGTRMVFDWTKVTTVTSVLVGSAWHTCLCQSRHVVRGSTSPCPF